MTTTAPTNSCVFLLDIIIATPMELIYGKRMNENVNFIERVELITLQCRTLAYDTWAGAPT